MKNRLFAVLLSLLLCATAVLFCACGSSGNNGDPYAWELEKKFSEATDEEFLKTDPTDSVEAGRKIIKTVNESVETTAYDDTIAAIRAAVSAAGGYFSSSSYTGGDNDLHYARFVVRIPADRLDEFGSEVSKAGTVTSYREEAEDVTKAYVDAESRIAVLEAEETALLAMLEKAEDINSILAVRSQLNGVQQDLASYRAQLKTYEDLVSYSTVNLSVREVTRVTNVEQNFFEQVGTTFIDSLFGVGSFFRGLGVGIFGGLPYIVLIGAIVVGIVFLCRAIIRRNKNKKQ